MTSVMAMSYICSKVAAELVTFYCRSMSIDPCPGALLIRLLVLYCAVHLKKGFPFLCRETS